MPSSTNRPPEVAAMPMPGFPIFVSLTGRSVLLLGGGNAALAKTRLLLKTEARITLVAPEVSPEMQELLRDGRVTWRRRSFVPEDLEGITLAIDAGEDAVQTAELRAAAVARNILVNVVDQPAECDFTVPALLDRSPVVVAISSGGCAPALSRNIRQRLEMAVPEGYARLAAAAAACREHAKAKLPPGRARQRFWDEVLDCDRLLTLDQPAIERYIGARLERDCHQENPGVTLVGAGPGDAGLLTLHAAEAIRKADLLLHDAHVGSSILEMARREARVVQVDGGDSGQAAMSAEEISAHMVRCARAGQRAVRLRHGNPFLEHAATDLERQGLKVRIVPGIGKAQTGLSDRVAAWRSQHLAQGWHGVFHGLADRCARRARIRPRLGSCGMTFRRVFGKLVGFQRRANDPL